MMDALIESCVKRKHQQRDQSARDGISVPDGAGKKFRNGKTLSISVYKHRLRKKVLENQLCETYTVSDRYNSYKASRPFYMDKH